MSLFISIDGVDGVGKTTVCEALAEALEAIYFKSPSQPFNFIRKLVDTNINPLTRYFFYRAAIQNDSQHIQELLASGHSVICDRYIFSTYAYHLALDERVEKLYEQTGIVMPSKSILLSASPEVRWKRISQRFINQGYDKELEKDIALQNKVASIFQTLDMYEVDTSNITVNETVDLILKEVSDHGGT